MRLPCSLAHVEPILINNSYLNSHKSLDSVAANISSPPEKYRLLMTLRAYLTTKFNKEN